MDAETKQLLKDIVTELSPLRSINIESKSKKFTFYYKPLTTIEKARIDKMCEKKITTIQEDGTQIERTERVDYLFPIYTILEKALDKNGKRLFSLTSTEDFKLVSSLPYSELSKIAVAMVS